MKLKHLFYFITTISLVLSLFSVLGWFILLGGKVLPFDTLFSSVIIFSICGCFLIYSRSLSATNCDLFYVATIDVTLLVSVPLIIFLLSLPMNGVIIAGHYNIIFSVIDIGIVGASLANLRLFKWNYTFSSWTFRNHERTTGSGWSRM